MGTNFYAVIPMKERSKKTLEAMINKLKVEINNNKYDKLDYDIYELDATLKSVMRNVKIHLGKRSYGWAFLWDANDLKYYEPTLTSIKKFIDDNHAKIIDEYGDQFTWDQFINDEIKHCLHPSIKPIMTVDELKKIGYDNDRIKYIKENYFNKNLPYYQYCTSETYDKMHSGSFDSCNRDISKFIKYAMNGMISRKHSDFITKEGLRFALFTGFS